jgi:replicative DNA helicase
VLILLISEFGSATDVVCAIQQGISLTVEQYNALLRAAPLLERELVKAGEEVVRPDYDGVEDDNGVDGEAEEEVVKDEEEE